MQTSKKSIISLHYLICSIYTLSNNDPFFKKINFKNTTYLSKRNIKNLLSNEKKVNEFYSLINSPLLKKFVFQIIQVILKSNKKLNLDFLNIENKIKFYDEIVLLKKYLDKFHYNYRHYFIYQNGDCINPPTNKEINTNAIKALILLTGV